jgi:hypothetical protein
MKIIEFKPLRKTNIAKEHIQRNIDFAIQLAKEATNGKVCYEGDDYWFILNALEQVKSDLKEL